MSLLYPETVNFIQILREGRSLVGPSTLWQDADGPSFLQLLWVHEFNCVFLWLWLITSLCSNHCSLQKKVKLFWWNPRGTLVYGQKHNHYRAAFQMKKNKQTNKTAVISALGPTTSQAMSFWPGLQYQTYESVIFKPKHKAMSYPSNWFASVASVCKSCWPIRN